MDGTMKKWLLIFCFLGASAFAAEIRLKDKLAEAAPGSYVVTEQSKNFTLVHIHDRTDRSIVIEEVTIPAARYARNPIPWRQWFESGAPGHTSWTMSQINLETGQFEETFSFTHQGWINLSDSDPFLTTLLNLPFAAVPEEKRRRVGIPPGYNKPDHRPIWNPFLTIEGKRMCIPFSVWRARWPSDGSELSRKYIEIYLPNEVCDSEAPQYPTYFPYWIEIDGKIGSAKVRIIDSGTGARSPKPALPLRPPELIGNGKLRGEGLALQLKTPNYYQDFMIVAEESGAIFGNTFPLRCETRRLDDQTVFLFVSRDELNKFMTPGETYRFLVSPRENPSICLETRSPLVFKNSL